MSENTVDAQAIALLVLDVDGVLTNGQLFYGEEGADSRAFDVRDGLGIKLLLASGMAAAIITGRRSPALSRRARDLGISQVFQGVRNKKAVLDGLLADLGLVYAQVAYMGDDVNDLSCLMSVGLPMAPSDACAEVLSVARFVASRPGGRGAVRQACELILKSQGRWNKLAWEYFGESAPLAW